MEDSKRAKVCAIENFYETAGTQPPIPGTVLLVTRERPEETRSVNVPCIIFDGRNEDFAAEMFVIINSTSTRINRSHLVDPWRRRGTTRSRAIS